MPGATEQEGVCKAGNLFLLGLRLKFPRVHSVFVNLKHTSGTQSTERTEDKKRKSSQTASNLNLPNIL